MKKADAELKYERAGVMITTPKDWKGVSKKAAPHFTMGIDFVLDRGRPFPLSDVDALPIWKNKMFWREVNKNIQTTNLKFNRYNTKAEDESSEQKNFNRNANSDITNEETNYPGTEITFSPQKHTEHYIQLKELNGMRSSNDECQGDQSSTEELLIQSLINFEDDYGYPLCAVWPIYPIMEAPEDEEIDADLEILGHTGDVPVFRHKRVLSKGNVIQKENLCTRKSRIPLPIKSYLDLLRAKLISAPIKAFQWNRIPLKPICTENVTRNAISPSESEKEKDKQFKLPEIRKRKSKIPVMSGSYSSSTESAARDDEQRDSEKRRKCNSHSKVRQQNLPERQSSIDHLPSIHEKEIKRLKLAVREKERRNEMPEKKQKSGSTKPVRLPPIYNARSRPTTPAAKSSKSYNYYRPPSSQKSMTSPIMVDLCKTSPDSSFGFFDVPFGEFRNNVSRPASITGYTILPPIASPEIPRDRCINRPVSVDNYLKLPPINDKKNTSRPTSKSEYSKLPSISKLI